MKSTTGSETERTSRVRVSALDDMLGQAIKVLDDGFVRPVDYLGSDSAIVQAARVSYGAGTKRLREDRGLIRYLMRHDHTTPFEMCEIKLHVRVPMDCWRQWVRHRTANINEYSTRYSVAIDATQRTPVGGWRMQSATNRQGSASFIEEDVGAALTEREGELHRLAREIYEERLAHGVAREQARKDLPLSTYTEAYWKIDLHNLMHFLRLRLDAHAQAEIRQYARAISDIVATWCPISWEAFQDYRQSALTFSGPEADIIRSLVAGNSAEALATLERHGMISRDGTGEWVRARELAEFEPKLERLGLKPDWGIAIAG